MQPDFMPAINLSGLSRENAYNHIESQISYHKDQIRSLLSLRNSLSPISSLPNHVICKVFMHCCDFNESGRFSNIRPDENDGENEAAQPNMRLVVSWVSRHWRTAAIGHRPLWNLVVNLRGSLNLDYLHACGGRCQRLAIDIVRPSPALLSAIASKLSQATYFKLDLSSGTTVPLALSRGLMSSQPAPLLQRLDLQSVHIIYDPTNAVAYAKLRSLILLDCDFKWNFIGSLALTVLKLDITDPKQLITIPACVSLLHALPFLSDCTLYNCLKHGKRSAVVTPRSSRKLLSKLKKLRIVDSLPLTIQLVRRLNIPQARLEVVLTDDLTGQQSADLFAALREMQAHVWDSIHYLMSHNQWFIVTNAGGSPVRHSIYLHGASTNILQRFACQHLDLRHLVSLCIFTLLLEDFQVFSRLPQLRKVILTTSDALKTFVTKMHEEAVTNPSIPFPAMEVLILVNIASDASLEGLSNILASRKTRGYGLKSLMLLQCDKIGIGEVLSLKEVVDVDFSRRTLSSVFF